MLSTGIPQLQRFEDLYYLRETLVLESSEQKAKEFFLQKIEESKSSKMTVVNNVIHLLAHMDG